MSISAKTESSVKQWDDFHAEIRRLSPEWIFRGQSASHGRLETTLERVCNTWELPAGEVPKVERGMIREFRRRYNRSDAQKVQEDTLYCLAIMRHHGAPTRLLDFTYSPYMAAYFALKEGRADRAIRGRVWAIRVRWIEEWAIAIFGKDGIERRNADPTRNDGTFMPMYMDAPWRDFVFNESPLYIGGNPRLMQQQGTFLCVGNVEKSFEANISAMAGVLDDANVRLYCFEMDTAECARTLQSLHRHGLNEGNLFPDLDGFARELGIRAPFFQLLSLQGAGKRDPGY